MLQHFLVPLVSFIVLSLPIFADTKKVDLPAVKDQTVTWVMTSSNSQTTAPEKTNVISDKHFIFKLFTESLSEYSHTVLIATVPRIEVELKSGRLVCFPGSSEANRRKQFSYLTSQYIQPPPQVVMQRVMAEKLLKKNKHGVLLKDLLKDKSLRGLVGESRSFGNTVDQILASTENRISTGVFDALGANVIQMIEKGRADYTIEYPFILDGLKKSNQVAGSIVTIPMIDAGPSMTQYVACSKTPEGKAVIKRLDKIIRDNIRRPEYWQTVISSIPLSEQSAFQKEINKFIEVRSKNSVIIE